MLIRVFVNQLVVFGVQELGLKSERVLDFRQVLDKDLLKLNWLRIECFSRKCLSKIKDISNLGSLRNTFPSRKSFPSIISDSILSIICKPSKQQITTNERPSSTFASITVNNSNISLILHQEIIHLLAGFEQKYKRGTVMIFPVVGGHPVVESCGIVLDS